jgi:hypothetical protein
MSWSDSPRFSTAAGGTLFARLTGLAIQALTAPLKQRCGWLGLSAGIH